MMRWLKGSYGNALGQALFQVFSFATSIPDLVAHMEESRGEKWAEYTRRVPSKLIPGIY